MPLRPLLVRLVAVLALAGLVLVPLPVTRVAATFLIVAFLPAWVPAMRSGASRLPALGLAAAASPALFGAVVLIAMLAGVHAYGAAWIAVAVFGVVCVLGGDTGGIDTSDAERRIARGLLVVGAVAAVFAFALPLTSEWWRIRSDSWFHAAVLNEVILRGVPPADPYFASLRLQYVYFYHVILAGVAALSGLEPFHAMILVNAIALAGFVLGFGYLASFFSRRVWPRVLGAVFALFAMNGLFHLFYPIRFARAFTGETSGAAVLHHFFPWTPRGQQTATRLLSVEGNQFLFLDKFMLGTAISLTFGLLCVHLGLVVSARRGRWSRAHALFYVVSVTGMIMLHSVVGIVAAVATLLVLALMLVIHAHPDDDGPSYAAMTFLTLAGVAIAAPYVYSVMPRGPSGGDAALRFAVQPGHLVGLLSDFLPALLLSIPFLLWVGKHDEWRTMGKTAAEDDEDDAVLAPAPPGGILMGRLFGELSLSPAGMVAMWWVIVLAIACVVDLPANNETKFSFLLFLPMAAFAVGGLNRLWRTARGRRFAVAFVVACTLPLSGVYMYQAAGESGADSLGADEMATYRWIEKTTPVDAVFIDSKDIVRIPVLAGRDLYWGNETYARNWSYPTTEMILRRATRDSTYSLSGPTPEQVDALRGLGRPVYVLARAIQFDNWDGFERLRQNPLLIGRFLAGDYAVFQFDFARADSMRSGTDQ